MENPYCNGDWVEVSESNEPDKSFWFIAQYVKCELKKGVLYHKVRHHILSPLYSCQYIRRYTPVIGRSYNIGQHVKFTIPENGSTPEKSSTPENGSCECRGQIAARKPGSYIIKIDEECKNKRRGWVDFYYISDELIF